MTEKIVNLTPHDVHIITGDEVRCFAKSGAVARVSTHTIQCEAVQGVATVRIEYGAVEGLPPPEPGTFYIVSMLVAQRATGQRDDLLSPNSNEAVRGTGRQHSWHSLFCALLRRARAARAGRFAPGTNRLCNKQTFIYTMTVTSLGVGGKRFRVITTSKKRVSSTSPNARAM